MGPDGSSVSSVFGSTEAVRAAEILWRGQRASRLSFCRFNYPAQFSVRRMSARMLLQHSLVFSVPSLKLNCKFFSLDRSSRFCGSKSSCASSLPVRRRSPGGGACVESAGLHLRSAGVRLMSAAEHSPISRSILPSSPLMSDR